MSPDHIAMCPAASPVHTPGSPVQPAPVSPVHTAVSPATSPVHTPESPVPSTSVQPLDHTPLPFNNDESNNDDFDNLSNSFSDSDSDHFPFSDDDNDDDFGIPLNQPPS